MCYHYQKIKSKSLVNLKILNFKVFKINKMYIISPLKYLVYRY